MNPYMNNITGNGVFPRRSMGVPRLGIYQSDSGGNPYIANLNAATLKNTNYRTAIWTGSKLQMTVMSIPPNQSIGLEIHPDTDQFLYIEQGTGLAMMGDDKNNLYFRHNVFPGFAIIIPAGKWHDITNTGKNELKLFTIYAPPHHKKGTVQITKKDAEIGHH